MAYTITYPWKREQELNRKQIRYSCLFPGILLITGALALRLLVPEIDTFVSRLLHPLMDEFSLQAAGDLTANLLDGMPIREAVTAFCREILLHG